MFEVMEQMPDGIWVRILVPESTIRTVTHDHILHMQLSVA
jgi:hypothetical protein